MVLKIASTIIFFYLSWQFIMYSLTLGFLYGETKMMFIALQLQKVKEKYIIENCYNIETLKEMIEVFKKEYKKPLTYLNFHRLFVIRRHINLTQYWIKELLMIESIKQMNETQLIKYIESKDNKSNLSNYLNIDELRKEALLQNERSFSVIEKNNDN